MLRIDLPSQETLDEVPGRVFTFLMGFSESLAARAALGPKGFDNAEHQYAWSRLQLLGALPSGPLGLDDTVRDAVVEIDAWDEPNFTAIQTALRRQHPEQAEFLFESLSSTQGPEAVLGVETLLDRLDALEQGEGREATREADQSALQLLAKRGYTPEERARLRKLVEVTRTVAPAPPITDDERRQILAELYLWLADWRAQARNVIKSRSTLIRLGLAQRRKRESSNEIPEALGDTSSDTTGSSESTVADTAA